MFSKDYAKTCEKECQNLPQLSCCLMFRGTWPLQVPVDHAAADVLFCRFLLRCATRHWCSWEPVGRVADGGLPCMNFETFVEHLLPTTTILKGCAKILVASASRKSSPAVGQARLQTGLLIHTLPILAHQPAQTCHHPPSSHARNSKNAI